MMAECMVTHGRGLDDFVRMEILEKLPNASNVRHLSEGKVAFDVSWAMSNVKTNTPQDLRANTIEQKDVCDSPQDADSKGTQKKENVTPNKLTAALGINGEEERHWVGAVCDVFKLKLVERVFILLHCEDIDPEVAHQNGAGKSDADAILTNYENKLHSFVRSIQWDKLAVRMRSVRKHQDNERQVWCQDHLSCPGSLRKRQARKEIGEKRLALASSRGMTKDCIKPHLTYANKEDNMQVKETGKQGNKRRKLADDCEMKETDVISCEYDTVHPEQVCVFERDTKICEDVVVDLSEQKNSVISSENDISQLDRGCLSEGITNMDEGVIALQSELKPSTNKIDVILEHHQSPISSPEHRSKKVRRKEEDSNIKSSDHTPMKKVTVEDQDSNINSNEHTSIKKVKENEDSNINSSEETSTVRVSSRVSGPFKNLLTVKWINHVLSQQLRTVTSWVPDWRHPLIDLYVNITASHFIVGAAMAPRPLSLRPYIPHLTLRSTISYLMATLSHMPPEATVLDPMCGGGSILLETAVNFDVSHVIASDINQEQLEVAQCNLRNLQVPVTLLQADAQGLPLQDSSINTVLCDFPFGQKYKLTVEDKHLLTRVLTETQRLLVFGGVAVFLLSPKQHQSLSHLTWDNTKNSSTTNTTSNRLTLLESHLVSLGETSAYITVMTKEHTSIDVFKDKEGL